MSPEQTRGNEPLDGRTDVYSLGVTLYEAITGEVPFHGALHMVLQQVCDDEPRPPRRLNDQVPRDLETICLKAMAKEPARRYATARDFAEDLRRWQDGEPIRARPLGPLGPLGRLGRWCRRNTRLAVLVASVVGPLILLTVISTAAAVRISREQVRTLEERQAARDHYNLALETLNSLVFNVNEKLGSRPGTLKLKSEILETARNGLERIARSSEADSAPDRDAVVAHQQLGDLLFALGRTPEARQAYEKSRDLARTLVNTSTGSVQPRRDLALSYDKLGNLLRYNNEIEGTEANFRQAIAIREQLIQGNRQDPEVLRDLTVSIDNIGLIHLRRGEFAEAMAQFRRALALIDQYGSTYPSHTKVMADYEYTYRQLAASCLMSDWTAGAEYSRKALESIQAVVAAEPEESWWCKKLAIDQSTVAAAKILLGDFAEAEAQYRKAMEVSQALLIAEPADAENQRNVAVAHRMLGDFARHGRQTDAVRTPYEKCLAICEQLAESDPGSNQKQSDVVMVLDALADTAERAERFAEGLEWVERTSRRLDRLAREKRMGPAFLGGTRAIVETRRAVYQAAARGLRLEDASTPVGAPADLAPVMRDWWMLLRAFGLARRGDHPVAAALARDIQRRDPTNAIKTLRCGRVYALCTAGLAPQQGDTAKIPVDRELRQRYIASALDAVRQTLRISPDMALEAILEPDFDSLPPGGALQTVLTGLNRPAAPREGSP